MHYRLGQGQLPEDLVDDLAELPPDREVSFVHPLLNGRQRPTDAGNIVHRPIGIRPLDACRDARASIATVLRDAGNQGLRFLIGERDTLPILGTDFPGSCGKSTRGCSIFPRIHPSFRIGFP